MTGAYKINNQWYCVMYVGGYIILSAEIAAKEQLKMVLEQHKMEARQEQKTLSM